MFISRVDENGSDAVRLDFGFMVAPKPCHFGFPFMAFNQQRYPPGNSKLRPELKEKSDRDLKHASEEAKQLSMKPYAGPV